jgi:hypothetical protein
MTLSFSVAYPSGLRWPIVIQIGDIGIELAYATGRYIWVRAIYLAAVYKSKIVVLPAQIVSIGGLDVLPMICGHEEAVSGNITS